jgi:outer membrane protein OmpA-like peptidoglycan-associated protein
VRAALIERGIAAGRLVADSAGASEPVSDNDTPRGRLRNRRVEARLYIPKRGT